MDGRLYLDTHLLVWLRDGELHKISPRMKTLIEERDLYFSEFVRLELQYLYEIGKLTEPANEIVMHLSAKVGIQSCTLSLPRIIQAALSLRWTRDPFSAAPGPGPAAPGQSGPCSRRWWTSPAPCAARS